MSREVIRTCIATRQRRPDHELVRIVARQTNAGWAVTPDPHRRLCGRGAWITPTVNAYDQAVRTHAFARAFRRPIGDHQQLGAYLAAVDPLWSQPEADTDNQRKI